MLKATVPYLSQHFRVITTDGRGNGRSDRPTGQDAYSFDHFYADFVAVLDAAGRRSRWPLVGISAAAMTVLRLAAEQPQRVTHVVIGRRLCRLAARATRSWPSGVQAEASACAATGRPISTGS